MVYSFLYMRVFLLFPQLSLFERASCKEKQKTCRFIAFSLFCLVQFDRLQESARMNKFIRPHGWCLRDESLVGRRNAGLCEHEISIRKSKRGDIRSQNAIRYSPHIFYYIPLIGIPKGRVPLAWFGAALQAEFEAAASINTCRPCRRRLREQRVRVL